MIAGEGTSSNPCRLDFRGFSPFSEKETMAARDWVAEYSDQILVYIDFHTYGQLWMTPYGYSSMTPPNELEMVTFTEGVYLMWQFGFRYPNIH